MNEYTIAAVRPTSRYILYYSIIMTLIEASKDLL